MFTAAVLWLRSVPTNCVGLAFIALCYKQILVVVVVVVVVVVEWKFTELDANSDRVLESRELEGLARL